jgi:hypothetical protein
MFRSFFYLAFLLLFALIGALPLYESDTRLQARVDPEASSNPKDWPTRGKLKNILKTQDHQATFWSGRRKSVSSQKAAEDHAQGRDGKTLEMALKEGDAKMPPWTPGDKKVQRKWTQAAKIFSKKAKGDVHAHIGETVRPNSVYVSTEKPTLLRNKGVNSITEHKHDGTHSVVRGRFGTVVPVRKKSSGGGKQEKGSKKGKKQEKSSKKGKRREQSRPRKVRNRLKAAKKARKVAKKARNRT